MPIIKFIQVFLWQSSIWIWLTDAVCAWRQARKMANDILLCYSQGIFENIIWSFHLHSKSFKQTINVWRFLNPSHLWAKFPSTCTVSPPTRHWDPSDPASLAFHPYSMYSIQPQCLASTYLLSKVYSVAEILKTTATLPQSVSWSPW